MNGSDYLTVQNEYIRTVKNNGISRGTDVVIEAGSSKLFKGACAWYDYRGTTGFILDDVLIIRVPSNKVVEFVTTGSTAGATRKSEYVETVLNVRLYVFEIHGHKSGVIPDTLSFHFKVSDYTES